MDFFRISLWAPYGCIKDSLWILIDPLWMHDGPPMDSLKIPDGFPLDFFRDSLYMLR